MGLEFGDIGRRRIRILLERFEVSLNLHQCRAAGPPERNRLHSAWVAVFEGLAAVLTGSLVCSQSAITPSPGDTKPPSPNSTNPIRHVDRQKSPNSGPTNTSPIPSPDRPGTTAMMQQYLAPAGAGLWRHVLHWHL